LKAGSYWKRNASFQTDKETFFTVAALKEIMPERKRLLVIDDDNVIRELICDFLLKCGFEIHSERDASDAIELLKHWKRHFDIIITDYSMPGMNGVDFTKMIKRHYPRTTIIGMSSFHIIEKDFLAAGAHAILLKPFSMRDMLSTINRAHLR